MSNNSMANYEVVDGTSNEVDNKILTSQATPNKGHLSFKSK